MRRSGEQINKLLAQRPDPVLLGKLYGEQGLVLGSAVGVPMANVSLVINQGRGSPIIPGLITLFNRLQLTILVDVIRKHEDAGVRDISEVV